MVVDVRCGGEFGGGGDGSGGGPGGSFGSPGDGSGGPEDEAISVLVAMERRKARTDAELVRAVAEFEASGAWVASGAVSVRAWLVHRCHLSRAEAGRQVRRSRALRHLPLVEAAFFEGAITSDHVDLLVGLDHGATKEPLHRHEQLLVDLARAHTFADFTRLVAHWRDHADPDGTNEEAEAKRNRRGVHLSQTLDGMWHGRMVFDPVSGTIVSNELERLCELLFEEDWAEATERLGRTPLTGDLRRTPSQRRADAVVMMVLRSASRPKGAAKPGATFYVHMDWDTVYGAISELEGGPPLPPRELLSWMEGADIVRVTHDEGGTIALSHSTRLERLTRECLERAVSDPPDRKECPDTDRIFTGATRRAIEIRDGQCSHPYCDRPARWCQVDHIKPWSMGGPTTQANGRLLCRFHNRWYWQHEQRHGQPPPGEQAGQGPPEERPPPRRE